MFLLTSIEGNSSFNYFRFSEKDFFETLKHQLLPLAVDCQIDLISFAMTQNRNIHFDWLGRL